MSIGNDTQLQRLIDSTLKGDPCSKELLVAHSCDRLLRLTRKMFHSFPDLRRWEQTDDVFQNAMVRLHRALADVQVESVRHFFNLAALQIRRELIDLTRHHFGPAGAAANHHTDQIPADEHGGQLHERAGKPSDLTSWQTFHHHIEQLPEADQEIVNLLFYEGLNQEEAAAVLGVSLRTLKRRWQDAKIRLYEVLNCDKQRRTDPQ